VSGKLAAADAGKKRASSIRASVIQGEGEKIEELFTIMAFTVYHLERMERLNYVLLLS
jgi:hypothetical protein